MAFFADRLLPTRRNTWFPQSANEWIASAIIPALCVTAETMNFMIVISILLPSANTTALTDPLCPDMSKGLESPKILVFYQLDGIKI